MRMIQIWLRVVASTGERRVISKDKMWSELVMWSLPRLEYYRDELRSSFTLLQDPLLENLSAAIRSKLAALRICCTLKSTVPPESLTLIWTEIITLCFELRYHPSLLSELEACLGAPKAKLMWRNIAFIGRLRSAFVAPNFIALFNSTNGFSYETFVGFAMQFPRAKSVEFCSVEAPVPRTLQPSESAELSGKLTPAGVNWDNSIFKENRKRVKTKARKLEIRKVDFKKQVRVHAEVQI